MVLQIRYSSHHNPSPGRETFLLTCGDGTCPSPVHGRSGGVRCIRRGYMLVAPTHPRSEPSGDASAERAFGGDAAAVRWWSRLCNAILTETGLGVVLADAGHAGLHTHRVREEAGKRGGIAILHDLSRGERSALLEISRGVCTGDHGLLTEARVRGAANYEPPEIDVAVREGRLAGLLVHPASGVQSATA